MNKDLIRKTRAEFTYAELAALHPAPLWLRRALDWAYDHSVGPLRAALERVLSRFRGYEKE